MGIQIQLEEPIQHSGYILFEAPWTWDEFDAQIDAMVSRVRAMSHPVAIVMDLTRIGPLPGGNVLAHLQRADSLMPDNVDIVVLVNAPYAFVNFVSILMRIRPRVQATTIFAHSLEEGRSIIRERRRHTSTTHP